MASNETSPPPTRVMTDTRMLLAIIPCLVTLAISVMILSIRFKYCKALGKTTILGILVFGTLASFSAEMVLGEAPDDIYAGYSIARNILSTFLQFLPCILFVSTTRKHVRIGSHHEGIQYFTFLLTLCIVSMEIAGICLRAQYTKGKEEKLYVVVSVFGIIQKATQGVIYQFVILKRKLSDNKYLRKATVLWCYMLSMYNFSMWVWVEEVHGHNNVDAKKFSWKYGELQEAYYALVIDYRLMFSLLYLEHGYTFECQEEGGESMELESKWGVPKDAVTESVVNDASNDNVTYELTTFRITLYAIPGVLMFGVQFLNIPSLTTKWGAVVNLVGILTETGLIIMCVCAVYYLNQVELHRADRGFDLMVALLGVFGVFFWLVKAFNVTVLANKTDGFDGPLMIWYAVKFWFRDLSCVLSILVYMLTDVSVTHNLKFCRNSIARITAPLLFWFYASVFVNSACDNVYGRLNGYLEASDIKNTASWIHTVGTPVYLGFIVHLMIHYLMLSKKILCMARKSPTTTTLGRVPQGDEEPRSSSENRAEDISQILSGEFEYYTLT